MNLNELTKDIHANACAHGWWDKPLTDAEIRCLIHSEWSEALEEYRAGRPMVWHGEDGKPEGIAVELIDGCIRILDYLGRKVCYFPDDSNTVDKILQQINMNCVYGGYDLPSLLDRLHLLTVRFAEDRNPLAECVYMVIKHLDENGLDPEALLLEKHEYNKTRPYRHGGKNL